MTEEFIIWKQWLLWWASVGTVGKDITYLQWVSLGLNLITEILVLGFWNKQLQTLKPSKPILLMSRLINSILQNRGTCTYSQILCMHKFLYIFQDCCPDDASSIASTASRLELAKFNSTHFCCSWITSVTYAWHHQFVLSLSAHHVVLSSSSLNAGSLEFCHSFAIWNKKCLRAMLVSLNTATGQ